MHTHKTAWKRISTAMAAILTMAMVGCGISDPSKGGESRAEEAKTSFSITDSFGHKVDFRTKPQRVCLLSATLLSIWYDLGGTAACTPSLTGNEKLQPAHAAAIKKVPKVGMIYAVNLERILATNPNSRHRTWSRESECNRQTFFSRNFCVEHQNEVTG